VYAGNEKLFDLFSQWVDLMEAYATQAAIAIQNAQLSAQLRDERNHFIDSEEKVRQACPLRWLRAPGACPQIKTPP
jgi:GAF domain-containing protein